MHLTRSRFCKSSAHLVAKAAGRIPGCASALVNQPVSVCDGVVQNGSWRGRAEVVGSVGVQGGADPLLHHDESQLRFVVRDGLEAFENLRDLVELHSLELSVRHAVAIDDDLLREGVVHLFVKNGSNTPMHNI